MNRPWSDETAGSVPRRDPGEPAPLSFAQERVRFLCEVDPDSDAFTVAIALRMEGDLDPGALRRALEATVARHEVLRSRFPMADGGFVQVAGPAFEVALPVSEAAGPGLEAIASEEAGRPFDLAVGPPVRARLVRRGAGEHVLLLVLHRIVCDAASEEILCRDLLEAYEACVAGREPDLPPLRAQVGDLARAERQGLDEGRRAAGSAYWRETLAGAPPHLELPTDNPRPTGRSHRAGRHRFALPAPLCAQVEAFGRRLGVTPEVAVLAAFELFLSRVSGQGDFLVGVVAEGRDRPEVGSLVGLFETALPLRARVEAGDRVDAHVVRVGEALAGARARSETFVDRIVDGQNPGRGADHAPLFQVRFAFRSKGAGRRLTGGLTVERLPLDPGPSRHDLSLTIAEEGGALTGVFEFVAALFEPATVARLAGHFEAVLEAMVAAPEGALSGVGLMPAEDRRALGRRWAGGLTRSVPAEATIDARFREIAAAFGDRVAVTCAGRSVSYGALDRWSDGIAARIAGAGVPEGSVVVLPAERSPLAVAMMLGVLKAGCAYLPLALSLPAARRAFILRDSGAALVLLPEDQAWDADETPPVLRLPREALTGAAPWAAGGRGREAPAYVMYTSGSTGEPKGVVTPHRGVLRLVVDAAFMDFGPDEVFLHLASPAFDAATLEVWGALLNGGRMVVLPQEIPTLGEIAGAMREEGVTAAWFTAGLFNQMVDHQLASFGAMRQVLAGGDILSPDHVARFLSAHPGCRLINGYGPTENTTFTTTFTLPPDFRGDRAVPIGMPVDGTSVYLLDDGLEPVPDGVPGEIWAGGDGVALGYLNRPGLTAERFLPDPFRGLAGALMYRTGDRGRRLEGGAIAFLGRLDGQVKINGFRIEPGEIEAALRSDDRVRDAVVLPVRTPAGADVLAGFVVPKEAGPGVAELAAELTQWLRARLPGYMVPAKLVATAALPLNASGKVDRRALSEAAQAEFRQPVRETVAPRTPVEALLFEVWSELLGHADFGIDESFFEIGGDSLGAMKVFFRLAQEIDLELPVALIFTHPTIRELAPQVTARLLEQEDGEAGRHSD